MRRKIWGVAMVSLIVVFLLMNTNFGSTQEKSVTIDIWDQYGVHGDTAGAPVMIDLITKYQKLHPNVQIKRTYVHPIKIRDQIRLALGAGAEPDLFYTWPPAAVLAGYAREGLLYDMTEGAKKLGWFDRFPDNIIAQVSDKGRLYAYPTEQDYYFVWYNKDVFRKVGLKEPATYKEFLDICDKLKTAGYVPMSYGNREKIPATNMFSFVLCSTAGKQRIEEVLFGNQPWTRREFVEAGKAITGWVENDYFPKGINAIGYTDAIGLFTTGQIPMTTQGTWSIEVIVEDSQFDLGFFLLPSINELLPKATLSGTGSQWEMSARSSPEVQKEAVKFLDFLDSDEHVAQWVEAGYIIPIRKGGLNWTEIEVADIVKKVFQTGDSRQGINGGDLHCIVPEDVCEELYNSLQSMVGGALSPEEALSRIQQKWTKAKAEGRIWLP